MTIKKAHFASGILIIIFVCLHLFNHLWSIFGAEEHILLMDALRKLYRNIFVEIILMASIVIQCISGVKLGIAKRAKAKNRWEKLQLWTGIYLLFFLLIHLTAVFGARLFLAMETNFYFGVAGINTFPVNLFFIPYYAIAILSFFGHLAALQEQRMQWVVFGLTPGQQAKIIMALGLAVTIVLFYGLTDQFRGVEIPEPYSTLFK